MSQADVKSMIEANQTLFFSEKEMRPYARALTDAVAKMHEVGFLHNDI